MKLCVSYANCQSWGLNAFLQKSKMVEHYEFRHYDNFRIILREQSADDMMKDAAKCDLFIYQPTPAIQYCELSTEQMLADVVPAGAQRLSYGYGFNHGFYPIVLHGQWQTSRQVLDLAARDPAALLTAYDAGQLHFNCAGRFLDCLVEQRRREESMDVVMWDFILSEYRHVQLFIGENHPASAYFAELARRFLLKIEPAWAESLPYATANDINLPCGLLVAPQAVCELGLFYEPEAGAQAFFRGKLEELAAGLKQAVLPT